MNALYANGCSHVCGSEIEAPGVGHRTDINLTNCFSQLVSDELNLDCINEAYPGGSNDRTVRTTLDYFLTKKRNGEALNDTMALIGWTSSDRMEIHDARTDYYYQFSVGMGFKGMDFTVPKQLEAFYPQYITHLTSEKANDAKRLNQIELLASFMKSNGIPYIFFNSCWALPQLPSNDINFLEANNAFYMYYANHPDYKHEVTKGGHVRYKAHKDYAKRLLSHIK